MIRSLRRGWEAFLRWRMKRQIAAVERQVQRQMAPLNQRLAQMTGRIKGLQEQCRRKDQQVKDLRAQVQAHLDAGERDAAKHAVLCLRGAEEAYRNRQTCLSKAETTYNEVLRLRDASLRQLEEGVGRSRQWLERMDWACLRAELVHIASSALSQVQAAGKWLAGLEGTFISLVASVEAEAEVVRTRMSSGSPGLRAEEEEALAESLLEEFEAKRRLTGEEEEEVPLTLGHGWEESG